ncbi:MAG: orotidine-5'-phosphate decarboxylase [Ardenticatenaceae bacterium]|nr:orotidine-5'-phosphate decarboxylase [Ardenticatenaceae bacterium]HBY92811.1 orotate phosphoribosyltransferase [Chloroflexota bacterium]
MTTFFDNVRALQHSFDTVLCLGLDPRPSLLGDEDRAAENPLLAWSQRLIRATADSICCVKPNAAFYLAHGETGWHALKGAIALAKEIGLPVLLDAKYGDIGTTAEAYAVATFHDLGADAVTLSPYLGRDGIEPFLRSPHTGVFVLCHTSNPSASEFQSLEVGGRPLYELIAEQATRWDPRVGLVVGATYPHAIAAVRQAAPDAWLLLPGIGAQGGKAETALAWAGDNIIVPISRGIIAAPDPRTAAEELRAGLNRARQREAPRAEPDQGLPPPPRLQQLAEDLLAIGALQFGDFTLTSGRQSPFYLDLRLLVSAPNVLNRAARAYADRLQQLDYDRLAALPYAALPIGTAIALQTGDPLIYPRREVKAHGRKRVIEGTWREGDVAVLIDDLITTGGSKVEAAHQLREAGLQVRDVLVLIDRRPPGPSPELAEAGLRLHAIMTLAQILDHLVAKELIPAGQRAIIQGYLHDS